jgi:hypothetical protein
VKAMKFFTFSFWALGNLFFKNITLAAKLKEVMILFSQIKEKKLIRSTGAKRK